MFGRVSRQVGPMPGSADFAVQLCVLGMAFACTELECSLAFVTGKSRNTEKSYLLKS